MVFRVHPYVRQHACLQSPNTIWLVQSNEEALNLYSAVVA